MPQAAASRSVVPDPRQIERRRVWNEKPTLRLLYADYNSRLLAACPDGPLLDIGAGTAHAKHTLVQRTERLVPEEPSPASLRLAPSPAMQERGCKAQGVPSESRSPALRERGDPARKGWVGEGLRRNLLFGYDH